MLSSQQNKEWLVFCCRILYGSLLIIKIFVSALQNVVRFSCYDRCTCVCCYRTECAYGQCICVCCYRAMCGFLLMHMYDLSKSIQCLRHTGLLVARNFYFCWSFSIFKQFFFHADTLQCKRKFSKTFSEKSHHLKLQLA